MTLVRQSATSGPTSTGGSAVLGSALGANGTLVAVCFTEEGQPISMSGWTQRVHQQWAGSDVATSAIAIFTKDVAGASQTCTATCGSGRVLVIHAYEVAGTFDQVTSNSFAHFVNTLTLPSLTPAMAGSEMIAGFCTDVNTYDGNPTITLQSPLGNILGIDRSGGARMAARSGSGTVSSALAAQGIVGRPDADYGSAGAAIIMSPLPSGRSIGVII